VIRITDVRHTFSAILALDDLRRARRNDGLL